MRARSVLVLCNTAGRDGGTESYLERILPELAHTGVAVTVVARRVASGYDDLPVRQVAWSREDQEPNAEAAAHVARLVRILDPDAVLASNVFDIGVIRAARAARRFVMRVHDHRAFCPNGDRRFPQFAGNCTARMGAACVLNAFTHGCVSGPHLQTFTRLAARMRLRDALAKADAFVVSSDFMARECARNGFDAGRIVVAPPPISRDDFADPPQPMPLRRAVLFAGRIVPQKGLASLVRAIGRIPEGRRPVLDVAGDATPELSRSLLVADRAHVVVKPLGRLDPPAMRAAVDAARVVAMPSLWDEPFGLVGIEAQGRARPAAAYAVGGIPEWIGSAGIAVAPGDERALARALDRIVDETHWADYARAAWARAQLSHPAHHVEKLSEVLCVS